MEQVQIAAPGVWYAVDYALSACLFSLTNPPRGPLWRRIGICSLLTAAAAVFAQVTDTHNDTFYFVKLFTVLGMAALILWGTCDIPAGNVLYFTCHAIVLGEFVTAFSWQMHLFLALPGRKSLPLGWTGEGIGILLLFLVWLYVRRFAGEHARLSLQGSTLLATVMTCVGIFLFSNISNVFRDTPFSGETAFQINLIRMLVDGGGLMLLAASRAQREAAEKRAEVEILQNLMEAQYAGFQTSERSMELIHQKYHDLKHQIAYLRKVAPDEERRAALDEMEEEIRGFEAGSRTGNHVLDTILTDKRLQCQALHIELTSQGRGELLNFVSPMDLSALLGNLLDNAIEYVSSREDPSLHWIEVSIREKESFVILEVGNPFEGELRLHDGLPLSTKGDDRFHGFGTKSIRSTAARYGGGVSFRGEDGWFCAKVSLQRP